MNQHLCPGCVRYNVSCPCVPCDGTVVEQCKEYDPHPVKPVPKGKPFMSDADRAKQVGGSHYRTHRCQVWDVVLDYDLDFWEGNVVKYMLRDKTNRLEDLKKARHYLDECIRQLEAR